MNEDHSTAGPEQMTQSPPIDVIGVMPRAEGLPESTQIGDLAACCTCGLWPAPAKKDKKILKPLRASPKHLQTGQPCAKLASWRLPSAMDSKPTLRAPPREWD